MSEKFLSDVKPLQQFLPDGSFLLPEIPALFRTLQSLGAPSYIDYDYLLSVSGVAVKLAWQPGWAQYQGRPNQVAYPDGTSALNCIDRALKAVGAEFGYIDTENADQEAVKRDIKAIIDDGRAVLVSGPYAWACVTGYNDENLYCVAVFGEQGTRVPPYNFSPVQDKIDGYYNITDFKPTEPTAQLISDTLKQAAIWARQSADKDGTVYGADSFNAITELMVWDEGFEGLPVGGKTDIKISFPYDRPEGYYRTDGAYNLADRFWAGYCDYLCMLNGYENFYRFLDKYAALISEKAEKIKAAALNYHIACSYSGELWKFVTPDDAGLQKFATSEVRYTFAAHLQRARIYTNRAVEIIDDITKNS